MPAINCSIERIIGQGCSGKDHLFPGRLCVTDLPVSKEGRGTEADDKPEGTQHVCETRTFQNGGTTYPSQPHPTGGLNDKVGSEGCLPSDTNPGRAPTPPPVPIGTQNLPVSVPPIRVDIGPMGFLQSNETGGGSTPAYGFHLFIYLDDILLLHQSKEELVQLTPLICQLFKALELVVNQKKSILTPDQKLEFWGFQSDSS